MTIMKTINNTKSDLQKLIKESLLKLDIKQFKMLYAIIVHSRAHNKHFISTQNFFNLWCELNVLCAEFDESFPSPYDDHLLLKSFYRARPYYFIDILPLDLIADLFSKHLDLQLNVLLNLIQIIYDQDYRAAHQYIIDEFNIDHTADELVSDLEEHIKQYS